MTTLSFPHPSSMEGTWITMDCSDKPVIQLCFPPFSFTAYLMGITQYCSVHSQLATVAVCYLLRAYHPLVSNCALLPYYSFRTCCCHQNLLARVGLARELVVVTRSLDEGWEWELVQEIVERKNQRAESFLWRLLLFFPTFTSIFICQHAV